MAQSFPTLPLAALSTLFLTSIFLIIYYLFATKCFSHNCQHHLHLLLRRLSVLRPSQQDDDLNDEDPFIAFSPSMWSSNNNNHRGLHDSDIRSIPTLQFRQELPEETTMASDVPYDGCAVCLNEFRVQDMLRVLPACGHGFHLDCIDVWLQSNANCPLCRISISGKSPCQNPCPVVAPSSSPQSSCLFSEMSDEDFVVIELGGNSLEEERKMRREEELEVSNRKPLSDKFDSKFCNANARKQQSFLGMMGDECIDVREKNRDDPFFSVQPIRRSFSLDSAVDRQQLYSTVQAIIQQNKTGKRIR